MQNVAMHLIAGLSRFAAVAFVSGLWQGFAMIAAVAISLRLLPAVSAAVRFAVWAATFVLLAAVPLLHLPAATIKPPHPASPVFHVGVAWGVGLAGIWAALLVLRTCQLLVQTVRLRRIWKNATPVVNSESVAMLQSARRNAILCTSADVDAPSVIGFFAPRLLVPDWMFTKLTDAELRQVVLHECEHLRRRDDWMNLLQKIALALFPLNPALLWVDRRLGLERELACDAGVVASIPAPYDYAHCLTRLAEHRMVRRRIALVLSAWSRQSELAHRVHALLRPMRRVSLCQARVSIALVGLGLAGLSFEMARVPGFVSFDAAAGTPALQQAEASPISSPAYARLAEYREGMLSRPKLVRAALPIANTRDHSAAGSQTPGVASRRPRHKARATHSRPLAHTVLLAAKQNVPMPSTHPARRSRVEHVYAVDVQFSPSYAAVPFGSGWLLIRL